jgi:hypothetical protein
MKLNTAQWDKHKLYEVAFSNLHCLEIGVKKSLKINHFRPENGGSMFLRNEGIYSQDYTAHST